ncbi:LodA/GoxA family CTQ-dependent oxidase [Flavobacterium branchiicola]|uniref:LodA/GoxA family CTQ-dependent oxidase n=1 Tax=Flavobacterium branchiicola TaxID=1114875 RepID=A0ABV9PDD4_9FLAO|nr:LodA/GoxA family CTQ-dependent oxidase [Flavobacterium branchiicola]MBS7253591.1 LodA/GoxA family CTQ-dependent oxidase [Flavobacterium branchiicola]
MKSIINNKSNDHLSCGCEDPIEGLRYMFCELVQAKRVKQGQCPVRRPVFLRTHGIMKGNFVIHENLPKEFRHGMFKKSGNFPAYVRYSSDLSDGRPDWMSTIGIGIKIFGIPGEKVVSDDGAETADLLLQNVPFFFVDNASDMCNFTKASLEGWGDDWVQKNAPQTNELLDKMAKPIRSVLETELWSVVPFMLGPNNHCKYILRPGTSTFAGDPDINDPDFMAKDLEGRIALGPVTLDIYIQKRPDTSQFDKAYIEEHFPLDRATVTWDEKIAIPVKIATIELPQQDITNEEQKIYGDWLSFNIGRVPEANQPVGSIAQARVSVYQTSADYRRKENNQPLTEPTKPGEPIIKNPVCPFPHHDPKQEPKALTEDQIKRITHVKIHPGIGIARVGDSPAEYYIGPEVFNPEPTQFGSTRDSGGAIKRQAARFRIYAYDQYGNVVTEVEHSKNSSIQWSVHLANKKAAWYQFNAALDIPATVSLSVPLRNPNVTGSGRSALCIDSGKTIITGLSMKDSSYVMTGNFEGTPVTLGELRTDDLGRLLVLPGFGVSASPANKPVYRPEDPNSFNNADGWYDDIADGPVCAKVTIGGIDFDADSAWVASAPPNFAPDLVGWRTMDDLLQNVYMQSGMLNVPQKISFNEHVRPILQRLSELQWVNKGFLSMFGAGAPMNFNDPELMRKLSQVPSDNALYPDPYKELRRGIYNSFRPTNTKTAEIAAWPSIYGDAFGYTNPDPNLPPAASTYLQLPPFYTYVLTNWVQGLFINDYQPDTTNPQKIEEVDLQKQPETLDRSAMHFCLADAFHPGAELTWPMRNASMFRAPYRIRKCEEGLTEPVYGATLDNNGVMAVNGPLYGQSAGGLTRWMALPWQGDTAFCRSGYDLEYDPYLPTFWPARVPNQILTDVDYHTLCDTSKPMDIRIAAFQNRPNWTRMFPKSPAPEVMMFMVSHFSQMGIVEAKPRPEDMDWLPENIYVENLTKAESKNLKSDSLIYNKAFNELGLKDQRMAEAGWDSEEQRNEFLTIKRRGN